MSRYEDAGYNETVMVSTIIDQKFPELAGANIKVVFDSKKKLSAGQISIARIKKLNEELKFLAMDENGVEYDYMITIDKQVWDHLDFNDRPRIIFHELCHTQVDSGKDNPYNIKDHEIQGFYAETDYNADDPRWLERVSVIAEAVHDPENEMPVAEIKPESERVDG